MPASVGSERAASLGTVPDFGFSGDGVRISGVTPGGAAEEAGLLAGDILQSYNGQAMADLQAYSNLLRQSDPGDVVILEIRRAEQQLTVEATLQAR